MNRLRILPLVAAALAAGALIVLAGCGGSDSSGSSAESWANDLCSSVTTWTDSVKAAGDALKQNPTKAGVEDALDSVKSASSTLEDDLKGLGKPDLEAGDQMKTTVDGLSSDLSTGVDQIESETKDVSGVSGVMTAISSVSGTLATMQQQVSAAFTELKGADAQGELKQAFSDASSCAPYRSS